jgi:transcriptional regulator with XRE-family HTH domain
MAHLNECLLLARHYWGFSQTDLAEKLGVSKSYLSEIESGKREVSLKLLNKYSVVLRIPASTLMLFSEELQENDVNRHGRYIIADSALSLLNRLLPNDARRHG